MGSTEKIIKNRQLERQYKDSPSNLFRVKRDIRGRKKKAFTVLMLCVLGYIGISIIHVTITDNSNQNKSDKEGWAERDEKASTTFKRMSYDLLSGRRDKIYSELDMMSISDLMDLRVKLKLYSKNPTSVAEERLQPIAIELHRMTDGFISR